MIRRWDAHFCPFLLVYCFVGLNSLEMSEWRGQNQRTLTVGWFPPSLTMPPLPTVAIVPPPSNSGSGLGPVSVTSPVPVPTASYISTPLKGSLQHTGHGDVQLERSWGTPESLDESVILCLCHNQPNQHVTVFYGTFTADRNDSSGMFVGLTFFFPFLCSSGNFRPPGPVKEKEGSNLQKMAGRN